MKQSFKYLDVITALFVAVLLISNIADTKAIAIGVLSFGGGTLLFPITYILGDVLTEVYGFAHAKRVLWIGFAAAVIMALTFFIVGIAPAAPDWPFQESYMNILGLTPRIVAGSLVAFLVGGLVNSIVLAKLKVLTKGKHLWIRTISSTVLGQLVDTTIFMLIAFYGVWPNSLIISVIISGYLLKVATEVIFTPITYLVVNKLKKAEKSDYYDRKTTFNPLPLSS
ncbi:MAG TPA: queuosine precursor transporter [Candidatus Levybacteria bacterium]|nr:queuosine precursor transporter [Candidatus Levybacteria bacterium]